MRITRLEAENFKRLKAIDITPDGNTVVIKGRNAQGKSSVLDAIWAALGGRAGAKELIRPIRDGESKARVVVELDDLVVERKWTASGSTVKVSPKAGNATLNSPQKILDELIGALSFDPLAFAESDSKDQVKTLIDLIGREKFEENARDRKEAYENRTEINREIKRLQAEVDNRADATEVAPVDLQAILDELEIARQRERLLEECHRLENERSKIVQRMEEIKVEGGALPTTRTGDEVRAELQNADAINVKAQRWIDLQEASKRLASAQSVSDKHTKAIEHWDAERVKMIEQADLPVPGLAFNDDGVTYNGVPFVQSSAAERLKVSVGMAMALNPELRVISIRDASLLDDDSKMALISLAEEHDYQIWYEVVGTSGEIGVIIEDGEVQS